MEIKFPLFVRAKDSGEIAKFDSIHALQGRVEEIDIENGEYQAWDKDGLPVELKLQKPAVWIALEPSSEHQNPDQLHQALLEFAKSVDIQLSDQLPVRGFETALDRIRAEQEKAMLASSPIRRFFARFK
jgi:hypothetical protein